MEMVDILQPPLFTRSGQVKERRQAIHDGDWIGTFNLWVIRTDPEPAILYQQRSAQSSWAPLKLDASVGGHYQTGEEGLDGLREAEEELGRNYNPSECLAVGRKLSVIPDERGEIRHNVVTIYLVTDNTALAEYRLDASELETVVLCPIDKLLRLHEQGEIFEASGLTNAGEPVVLSVTQDSFPVGWDNYHYKMARLAKLYAAGERDLVY